ncbi:hypothetical protein NUW58_g7302 [Xylaria curta]|uniref:Uncharacterized protein n=1 Tax=Xylaria curta TaxID=42375 RepID=A0ACC1NJE7_9PEZI|nr:hypothetical protein NUW58_g7302 [Xylaria curta]
MGVGRYFCVALPFILTVASIIAALIVGLSGVTSNDLYLFRIDVTNLTIDATQLQGLVNNATSLVSGKSAEDIANDIKGNVGNVGNDVTDKVKEVVGRSPLQWHDPNLLNAKAEGDVVTDVANALGGAKITASDIGLAYVYDFTLWGYCTTPQDGNKNCTKARFDWASQELDLEWVDRLTKVAGLNVTLPKELDDALNAYKTITKWTQVVFIIAIVALGLELLVGLFTACSRAVSCVTWIISGFATAAIIAAAILLTVTGSVVTGAVLAVSQHYGVKANLNQTFLGVLWVSVAFAIGAGLFWLFSICCCKPENRPYVGSSRSRHSDTEKLVPNGSYAPLGDNRNSAYGGYNYGAPQRGGARVGSRLRTVFSFAGLKEPCPRTIESTLQAGIWHRYEYVQAMSHEAVPPGRLRREYALTPITALAFLTLDERQYLLAAEDTDIIVYDVAASRLCGVLPVFHAQPIHGISVPPTAEEHGSYSTPESPSHILVWGGHAVKVLPSHVVEELIRSSSSNDENISLGGAREKLELVDTAPSAPEAIAPDWILDGRISPFDHNHIVLLTAHNEVIQGHVSANQGTLTLGRVQSPSRPILYSGNFFWVQRDCVLVAAGTVFGEIVVWKCHLGSGIDRNGRDRSTVIDDAQGNGEAVGCEVLFVFSGHEGSIFGVNISPPILTSSGETIRLLASCSDDRTIRIWDITERSENSTNDDIEYETQISIARQTGFGDSIVGSFGLINNQSRCVAMAMGHVSRIWQVEIKSPSLLSRGDMIEVYSFGEDATMQRWHLELDAGVEATSRTPKTGVANSASQSSSKLTHHETFSNHSGKQIWSHAMVANKNSLLIATGGGDGKIALMEHDSVHASKTPNTATDDVGHYPRSIQELEVSPMYLIEKCKPQNIGATPSMVSFKHGNGKEMFQSFTFITDDRLLITTRSGRLFLGSFGCRTEWKELTVSDAIRTTIQSYTILRSSRRDATAFIGTPNGELFYYHEASGESLRPVYKAERKITEIICLPDTLTSSLHMRHNSAGVSGEYIEVLVTVFGSTKSDLLRLDQDRILIQKTEVTVPDEFIERENINL